MSHEQVQHEYSPTDRNRVRRVAKRGIYDYESVHRVIDAAWVGHIAFADAEHGVTTIPMLHARMGQALIFHGARSSRLMKFLASGQPVSVSFCLVDGLVLAKSLFHHSMNYRSAVVFGRGELIEDESEQIAALKAISDKLLVGRWEDAREPNAKEMSATAVVRISIESASAKIRTGGPADDAEDQLLPIWSGVLPIHESIGEAKADKFSLGIDLPGYLQKPSCRE